MRCGAGGGYYLPAGRLTRTGMGRHGLQEVYSTREGCIMGWISDRHMKSGGSLNRNPKNNGSDKGPLRLIVEITGGGSGMFDRHFVKFECGHEGRATPGAVRGRCRKCKVTPEA